MAVIEKNNRNVLFFLSYNLNIYHKYPLNLMWSIENSEICCGTNNISIEKISPIIGDIKVFLSKNNKKQLLNYQLDGNIIQISLEISDKSNYQIIIKEKNETTSIDLVFKEELNDKETISIEPHLSYLKGILTLNLNIKNIKSTHTLTISGDINKVVEVNRATSCFQFHLLINDFKVINFRINDIIFSQMVIDYEKFPNKLNKILSGVRLNKPSQHDLTIIVDGIEHLIQSGKTEFPYVWDDEKQFDVFIEGYMIFSQTVSKNNYLPELTLISDPLRVKIGSPSLKNIEVYIKGQTNFFVIEAGQTEIPLELNLEEGIRLIEISKVINALPLKNTFTFLIK